MSEKKIPNWGKKSQPQNNVRRVDVDEFDVGNGTLREVDKKSLYPDPNQPRRTFNDESLVELKESIETNGLLQPIIVCEVDNDDGMGKYRIIAGERRWREGGLRAPCLNTSITVLMAGDVSSAWCSAPKGGTGMG